MIEKAVYKSVTWRIIATIITMSIVYGFTRRWDFTIIGGVVEVVLKLVAYYVHEKVWGD